jgi:hypothetical protein
MFCLGSLAKASGNLIWNCFGSLAPHGNAGSQAQHSHGKTQTASPSWSQSGHRPFSFHVLDLTTAFHAEGGRCQKPPDSHGDRATDALWDACDGHDPTVAAATTQRWRSPAPHGRKKNNRRNSKAHSKSRPPSGSNFFSFHNPSNGICKYHNFYGKKAHKCIFTCT